jgi:hypothetical protein|tara:strand:- start:12607 stop:14496 length:1890 start_codon:yes stop_codon:yes gene_type:complete
MPLTKLQFRPGINRETTSYSNEGGWFDCDKIRFNFGLPQKLGGWEKYSSSTYLGTARRLHNWVALDGSNYLGVGTHLKYYIEEGGSFNDVTPIRATTSAGDVTFSATNGSTTITVTDSSHGAQENDFVTFSGAVSLGGVITATVLNQEYQVVSVPTANTFTITSSVAANSSDSGNGGGSVVGTYQINVGLDTQVGGTGWGAGAWGDDGWGSASSVTTSSELRTWSHDNFGEDLIINPVDGGIFYWDRTNNLSTRAVLLNTLSGTKTSIPTIAKQIMVSDIDRHVIAFGCDAINSSNTANDGNGTQDPLLIRFSDQEDPLVWYPAATNTAGDIRIGSGSKFVQAVETKREILVYTDTSLHSLRFIGPPFTFGIQQLASNITIASSKAAVAVEDAVFWMGNDNFYLYSGQTQPIPCSVRDKVFLDFDYEQQQKVVAGVNSQWGEVFWFYPSLSNSLGSGGTGENDKYVVYNYIEKVWYFGSLSRTAWIDRGLRTFPIAASSSYLFNHEFGEDDDGSAMTSFIESSQIDIADGDQFSLIRRVIPDFTFDGSSSNSPAVSLTLKARNAPGGNYLQTQSKDTTRTATTPVEQFTNVLNMRLRGRSFAMRVDSTDLGVRWKIGSPRVDLRQDGRR